MTNTLSDTHIYLDLDIVNNKQDTSDDPPVLRFVQTRNTPFLAGDSADYFVSILRFSVQTGNDLPVWIPRIEVGSNQMDINKTVYKVSVKQGDNIKTVSLSWIPWDLSAQQPTAPVTKQDLTMRYYYMYNFAQFVDMMNLALKDAWTITGSTIDNPPFIEFDTESNKFNLNADNAFISAGTKIFFNTRLYELLSSMPAKFLGNKGNLNYDMVFTNNHETNVRPIYKPSASGKCNVVLYNAIQTFQEIITISMWSPITSIVFTSSLLPIKSTNTSPAQVFNDSSTEGNLSNLTSSGDANLSMVLTDFVVALSGSNQYRPSINFNIQSEYRLIDMYSMPNLN